MRRKGSDAKELGASINRFLSSLSKGQDKLDVVFHVKTYEAYIWLEGDKVYSYYPIVEGVPVTFEIINNTAN